MDNISTSSDKKASYNYIESIQNPCWFCGSEMIWGSDFSYEDYGLEGDGVVATLTCSECDAYAEFYSKPEEEQ